MFRSGQISLEKSDTTPDYSVEEDQYGRLYNQPDREVEATFIGGSPHLRRYYC
ncbi:hypothetical protein DICVIV_10025 [Dictyocaulus viviparus]|uniref:Uncharacterized protein n=1 Tax=Dictyocaulus viviparus TaxID=29172 RepID=A0A0D8XJF3_DICVI|nr:hypothetical protein DICVIV_10025 [Dictyocaulus viviparus]